MKLLLTGYRPFAHHQTNPSGELVDYFAGKKIGNITITTAILPVSFSRVEESLSKLNLSEFDCIICLGLAGNRDQITPELSALNFFHNPGRADNDGLEIEFQKINKNAKDAYFSKLPLRNILKHFDSKGIDSSLSQTAGSYVCNQTFYLLMEKLEGKKALGGFIHIPNWKIEKLQKAFTELFEVLDTFNEVSYLS